MLFLSIPSKNSSHAIELLVLSIRFYPRTFPSVTMNELSEIRERDWLQMGSMQEALG